MQSVGRAGPLRWAARLQSRRRHGLGFPTLRFREGGGGGGGLGEGGVVGDFCNGDEAVSAVERCGLGVG